MHVVCDAIGNNVPVLEMDIFSTFYDLIFRICGFISVPVSAHFVWGGGEEGRGIADFNQWSLHSLVGLAYFLHNF